MVKSSSKKPLDGLSIESIGRFLGVAVALCLIVVPLILAGWNVLENAVNSDEETDPCSSFNGGESIEFDDVGFLCLDYNDSISARIRLKQQKSISSLNLIGVGLRNSVGPKPAMW